MTNEEFGRYLEKGLGRAVLLLQKEEDPGAFEETLREWLFAGGSENGVSAVYKKDLINCLPNPEAFVQRLSRDAVNAVRQGKPACAEDVLRLYGAGEELCRALEGEYARCLGELHQYTERGIHSEEYPDCARRFFLTVYSIVRLTGEEARLERILLEYADLYAINKEVAPAVPLIPTLGAEIGWKKMRKLLERVRARHPFGQYLWEQPLFPEDLSEPEWLRPPLTVEQVRRYAEDDGEGTMRWMRPLRQYMRDASPELLEEIALLGREEKDPRRRHRLLLLFAGDDTVLDPPPYPLSPDWLIGQVETVLLHPEAQPEKWEINAAQVCLRLLCRIRHPLVREYAETLLQTFSVPESDDLRENMLLQRRSVVPESMIRRCALQMRWRANFEEADRAALSEILLGPGGFDCDVCAVLIVRGFALGETVLLPEWIPPLYENQPLTGRYELVQALLEHGMLTEEMRRETKYDAWKYLRQLMEETEEKSYDNDEG